MRLQLGQMVRDSLILNLENTFLEEGGYVNVATGDYGPGAKQLGLLERANNDPIYGGSRVWQSPFLNFVHESGTTPPAGFISPVHISGIWVTGQFKGRTDSTYPHNIDFANGRVIFNSNQSTNLEVRMNYSYKEAPVFYAFQDNKLIDQTSSNINNVGISGINFPSGSIAYLPAVFLQYNSQESNPMQLGGGKFIRYQYALHILTDNFDSCDNLSSVIMKQLDKSLPIIDFRSSPIMFNEYGDKASTYASYATLKSNNKLFDARYLEMSSRATVFNDGIYRTSVFATIEVTRNSII